MNDDLQEIVEARQHLGKCRDTRCGKHGWRLCKECAAIDDALDSLSERVSQMLAREKQLEEALKLEQRMHGKSVRQLAQLEAVEAEHREEIIQLALDKQELEAVVAAARRVEAAGDEYVLDEAVERLREALAALDAAPLREGAGQ